MQTNLDMNGKKLIGLPKSKFIFVGNYTKNSNSDDIIFSGSSSFIAVVNMKLVKIWLNILDNQSSEGYQQLFILIGNTSFAPQNWNNSSNKICYTFNIAPTVNVFREGSVVQIKLITLDHGNSFPPYNCQISALFEEF